MIVLYVLTEFCLCAFLSRHFYLAFRNQRTAIPGLLVTVAISMVLCATFYLASIDCTLLAAGDVVASLYGDKLEGCFKSPRLRMALSMVLSLLYASFVLAIVFVLTRRSSSDAPNDGAPPG